MLVVQEHGLFFNLRSAVLLFLAGTGICFGQSTWEMRPTIPQARMALTAVAYGNNQFVAVGAFGAVLSSPDATTWTQRYLGNTDNHSGIYSLVYADSLFLGLADTCSIYYSPDGTNWLRSTSDDSCSIRSICYGNGMFVFGRSKCGANVAPRCIFYITPNFKTHIIPIQEDIYNGYTAIYLENVTYLNSRFIAIGNDSTILSSPDGRVWTLINSTFPYSDKMLILTYGNNKFVGVGYSGLIISSIDGINWTKENSGTNVQLWSVTFGNNQFVAVGDSGTILTSPDGTTWTARNSGTTLILTSVTYGNGQFVAVGENWTILTSMADNIGIIQTSFDRTNISRLKINIVNNRILCYIATCATTANLLKIDIFTISGKRMFSTKTKANSGILNIPTSGYSAGVYYLSITEDSKNRWASEFVLSK